MIQQSQYALMKQENYQLKNQISQLKNAFDLNRDVLKIISDESKSTQPRLQMLYQIINRLTNINNQVMIGSAQLIHQKNLQKFQKQAYKRQTELLKDRIDDMLQKEYQNSKFADSSKATQMHVFLNNKISQLENQIKVLEQENIIKDQQIFHMKIEFNKVFDLKIVQLLERQKWQHQQYQSKLKTLKQELADHQVQAKQIHNRNKEESYQSEQFDENNKSLIPTIDKKNKSQQQKPFEEQMPKEQTSLKNKASLNISLLSLKKQAQQMQLFSPSLSSMQSSPFLHISNNLMSPIKKQSRVLHLNVQSQDCDVLMKKKRKYSSNKQIKQEIQIALLNKQISRLKKYITQIEYRLQIFIKVFQLTQETKVKERQSIKQQHRRCLEQQYEHQLIEVRLLKFAINNLNKQQKQKDEDFMFKITHRKGHNQFSNTKKSKIKAIQSNSHHPLKSSRFNPLGNELPRYQHRSLDKYDIVRMVPKIENERDTQEQVSGQQQN